METNSYKREEIVVIGGGLEGCLAAIFAARVKNAQGLPQYHVTLLEANPDLLMGASSAAARLHLGAEYPNDPQTGKDCLLGAAIWKIIMPKHGIFTDQEPLRFLVAQKSEEKGRRGKLGSVQLHKPGGYLEYYQRIRRQYKALINAIHKEIQQPSPPPAYLPQSSFVSHIGGEDASRWNKDRIAKALFGPVENFSRTIDDAHEFHWYGSGYIAGGFKSQEPGINIPYYLEAVKAAVKDAGVEVVTHCPVTRIEQKTPGKAGYIVHCEGGKTYDTSQIIQAAWQGGFALDGEHRQKPKTVHVYRRAMALVDIRDIHPKPPPSFVLKDEYGGMYSPLQGGKEALVYHPIVARLGECTLHSEDPSQRSIPKDWKTPLTPQQEAELMEKYKNALVYGSDGVKDGASKRKQSGVFPFLKNAKFKKIIVQTTLNFQDSLDQRRHEPTEEIKPGYHVMYATKLTLSPQSAIEAIEKMRLRSIFPQHAITPPESAYVLNRALCDETYRLGDVIKVVTEPGSHAAADTTGTMGVKNRTFGQGFGDFKVSVYANGPKTGPLFDKDPKQNARVCNAIKSWASKQSDGRPFTEVITPRQLAMAMANRLMHADTLDIIDWLKDPSFLTSDAGALLFAKENLAHFPAESWKAIRESRTKLPARIIGIPSAKEGRRKEPEFIDSAASMLPALFLTLNEDDQQKAAAYIAQMLHKRKKDKEFFAPLADRDLNKPVITRQPDATLMATTLGNNGRSLQVDYQDAADPQPSPLSITFQGKQFQPVQFHFHRTRNLDRDAAGNVVMKDGKPVTKASVVNTKMRKDGEFEFKLYRDAAQEKAIKQAGEKDPNDEAVGELHAIFMTPKDPHTGRRSALALCAHVKLGEKNAALDEYISRLNALNHPLGEGEKITLSNQRFAPFDCFNHGAFDAGEIPEAPFASLNLGGFDIGVDGRVLMQKDASDIFYNGVHVVHLPDEQSVTISVEQLEALEKAQPRLIPLRREIAVNPVSRTPASFRGALP